MPFENRRTQGHRGFTLLELLIAIALMALLAVLGWRGLDSVLRSRERIAANSDDLRGLSVAFSQLDEDLRRSWAVRLLGLPVPPIAFTAEGPDGVPALQLLRELPPGLDVSQVQRVVYRVRDGLFERGFAPWAPPVEGSAASVPERPMTWQPLLADVARVQMRGWVTGQGWVPAATMLWRPGSGSGSTAPVTGLEVLVERRDGVRVLRVFPVKD